LQLGDLIGDRRLVTVSGARKGVGKTALAEILLRNLPHFAAIKITITDKDVAVTDDERDIMAPSTDTCRMKQSGALKVVWVRSTEDHLHDSMIVALGKMVPCKGILIEGNSILKHVSPTVAFFVIAPPFDTMKPSRVHALKNADIAVINQVQGLGPDRDLLKRIEEFNPRLTLLRLNLLDPGRAGDDYNRLHSLLKQRIHD
jgi:molybdopterin-guanine dinucleotide biosynthesis protein